MVYFALSVKNVFNAEFEKMEVKLRKKLKIQKINEAIFLQAENAQFDVKLDNDGSIDWKSAFIIIPNSAYQLGTFTITVVNASLLDYEDEAWRNIKLKVCFFL